MSVSILLAIIALVLGIVTELQTNGRSLVGWAVIAIAAIFLWTGLR